MINVLMRRSWIGLLMMLMLPGLAQASCRSFNVTANAGTINYTAGAHGTSVGSSIGSIIMAGGYSHDCNGTAVVITQGVVGPARSPIPNMSYVYNNQRYAVFPTSIPGIGYAFSVSDYERPFFQPFTNNVALITAQGLNTKTIGFRYQLHFVVTGPIASGSYPLNNLQLAFLVAGTVATDPMPIPYMTVNATFNIKAETCTLTSSSRNATLELPAITSADLGGVAIGNTVGGPSQVFAAEVQCPSSINVWASVSDANNRSNTSTTLTSAAGANGAKGVGLQLFNVMAANTPLRLGPDTTSSAHPGAWYVGTTPSSGGIQRINLFARYVRTSGDIQGGPVKSVATLTFSYR